MTGVRCLVIDTSSFIELREIPKADRRAALAHFDKLLLAGELSFPEEVAVELGEQEGSEVHAWAAANKKAACRGVKTWPLLREVYRHVPLVFDPSKAEGEEADGHVLALALQLRAEGIVPTVVTEERRDRVTDTKRLTRMSIASACGVLQLYCINLKAYLHSKGLLP